MILDWVREAPRSRRNEARDALAWRSSRLAFVLAIVAALSAVAVGLLTATPALATTPGSTYDTAVHAYEVPSRLLSPDAVSTYARGSPSGPGAASRVSFASIRSPGVAANTAGASGLPRNALGQFTSGAGGESAAAAAGRSAHSSYPNALGWSGDDLVQFNRTLPGSSVRPDAVNWTQRVVAELKPDNPSAIAGGWRQVNGYRTYLEELTGQPWTAQLDVYTP